MALTACEAEQYRTELDEVQMELDELKQRLDEFCARFNTNLAAIKSIVEASRTNDYISGVKPLIENGVEVGYVLTLTQGGSVAVYHGKDAADGAPGSDMTTPAIGVRMDENGFWCWTSGGEWLLGPDGEKIRAEAVVPQFKIQDRYWYVSYDKGKTWVKLQRAAGADGVDGAPGVDAPDGNDAHCVFEDVSLTETEVIFRLLSGEVFTLPRHGKLDVVFDVQDYEANVFACAEIKVNYTLKNATALTKVSVSSDGNYTVRIEKTSDSAGSIFIQCPDVYKDGYVNFIMADGNGYASVRVLNFYESRMEFADGLEYRIPSEGGKVTVPYAANFNYSLVVDDQSKSWLSLVKTKAIMETAEIEISASANMESYTRVGRIYVKADNSDQAYAEIIVNQASSVFTPADTVNYNTVEADVTVEVAKANPEYTVPTGLTATYGDTLAKVELPAGWTWNDAETTFVGNAGTSTFKATFTPADTTNYIVVESEVTITVAKAEIDGSTLINPKFAEGLIYNGTAQALVTKTGSVDGGHIVYSLSINGEYTTTIPVATEAGNYRVYWTIECDENHYVDGTPGSSRVTIAAKDASNATVTLDDTSVQFDGTAKTPGVTSVVVDGKTLNAETDYEVSYRDNTYVGTATVTITFKGNYTGTATATFEIIQDPKTGEFDGEWVQM